jgi:hypothetical protein
MIHAGLVHHNSLSGKAALRLRARRRALLSARVQVADGLHINDWADDRFARNRAVAIIASVIPPAMASAPIGSLA